MVIDVGSVGSPCSPTPDWQAPMLPQVPLINNPSKGTIKSQSNNESVPSHLSWITNENATIFIGYLKSYSGMGRAKVTCMGGCSCAEADIDAHHEQQTSQTYLSNHVVSS